jgi:hypothetical protein
MILNDMMYQRIYMMKVCYNDDRLNKFQYSFSAIYIAGHCETLLLVVVLPDIGDIIAYRHGYTSAVRK